MQIAYPPNRHLAGFRDVAVAVCERHHVCGRREKLAVDIMSLMYYTTGHGMWRMTQT